MFWSHYSLFDFRELLQFAQENDEVVKEIAMR